ncbi:MAG: AAA family ATPase [Actinomycetota bacterium]
MTRTRRFARRAGTALGAAAAGALVDVAQSRAIGAWERHREAGRYTLLLPDTRAARRWLTFVADHTEAPNRVIAFLNDEDQPRFMLPTADLPDTRIVVDGVTITTSSGSEPDQPSDRYERSRPATRVSVPTGQADQLRRIVARVIGAAEHDALTIWAANSWGEWGRYSRPHRPWRSVILPTTTLDRLAGDLDEFTTTEDVYLSRGIPWRRGYLLTGPPGTGKSSLAHALASRAGYSLAVLNLGGLKDDVDLTARIASLPDRSILLLEDIDAQGAPTDGTVTEAAGKDSGVSLAGILNALDGPTAPHGLIVIATTNHPERLAPALTRPGRFDIHLELGPVTTDLLPAWFDLFHGISPTALPDIDHAGLMPAELAELMKTAPTIEHARTALHERTRTCPPTSTSPLSTPSGSAHPEPHSLSTPSEAQPGPTGSATSTPSPLTSTPTGPPASTSATPVMTDSSASPSQAGAPSPSNPQATTTPEPAPPAGTGEPRRSRSSTGGIPLTWGI